MKKFNLEPEAVLVWSMVLVIAVASLCGAAALVRWTFF